MTHSFTAINADDVALAKKLLDEGYESTSNKYRHLARVTPGMKASEELACVAPEAYKRNLEQFERWCKGELLRVYCPKENKVEVSSAVFQAFKKLGGNAVW